MVKVRSLGICRCYGFGSFLLDVEAGIAINRTVSSRSKGYLGRLTALGAVDRCYWLLCAGALEAHGKTATGTAPWFVY